MSKVALITGASGFVAPYLAKELHANGYSVTGLVRHKSHMDTPLMPVVKADVTDLSNIMSVVDALKPDVIFHLAAQSYVPESWNSPIATLNTNVHGTLHILDAVRRYCPRCVVHVAGSSEEYGLVYPSETPIRETNPLRPLSPYAVSKIGAEKLAYQYAKSYGLKVVITRAFNHTGVGRGEHFVTSTIVRQGYEIATGKREHFLLGNLDAIRDFSHVGDVVVAYRRLAEALEADDIESGEVFNICSGEGYSIYQVVEQVARQFDVSTEVMIDPKRQRPSDVPILIGSYEKLKGSIMWKPKRGLSMAISEMCEAEGRSDG